MEKVNHAPQENHVFLSIRQLTVSGLLAGITIFLGLTGYGFIPLPPFFISPPLSVPWWQDRR